MKNQYLNWEDVGIILTINQLASLLCISRSAAYALTHRKDFPTTLIGSRIVVEKENLRKWLSRNTNVS